jgi:hypothetical protein
MAPHKLYIDSRARVNPAGSSHTDFAYQLSRPIEVPESRAFVDSVSIPNIFPSIHANNRHVYIEETVSGTATKRKVALIEGSYNITELAVELAARLSAGSTMPNSYTVTANTPTARLTIANLSANSSFSIWTADYLRHGLWDPLNSAAIPDYIANDDCYDVIGFAFPTAMTGNASTPIVGTGHVNVCPYHTLFLHSDLGLQGDSIGPNGENSIVRKVILDQPQGSYVHDRFTLAFDYVRVPKSQIRQIHFRLSDHLGRTVDLQHNSFSFSILFIAEEEL